MPGPGMDELSTSGRMAFYPEPGICIMRSGPGTGLRSLFEQCLPAFPSLIASFFIWLRSARLLSRSHKSMPGTVISNRLIALARRFHGIRGSGDRCVDTSVVARIKTINGRGDVRQGIAINVIGGRLHRWRAVEERPLQCPVDWWQNETFDHPPA